jgi:hypothetical protein
VVQAIKQTVTVGEGGRIEIPQSELPPGSTVEVIVAVSEQATQGDASKNGRTLSPQLEVGKDSFDLPADADEYLNQLRKEWGEDEERRRPISYYFGKGKGRGFKDCAEADAFIRAERDAWED